MIVRHFISEQDEEYGTFGFRPVGQPHFNAVEGDGIAHDTLEHFPHDDGGAEAEFEAFGAIIWGRGDGGWWRYYTNSFYHDVSYHLQGDVSDILKRVDVGDQTLNDPGRTCALDFDTEETMLEAMKLGIKDLRDKYSEHAPSDENLQVWQRRAIGWMRRGYRRARRRYRGLHPTNFCELYKRVADEANEALKAAEEREGLNLTVVVSPRDQYVAVRLKDGYRTLLRRSNFPTASPVGF